MLVSERGSSLRPSTLPRRTPPPGGRPARGAVHRLPLRHRARRLRRDACSRGRGSGRPALVVVALRAVFYRRFGPPADRRAAGCEPRAGRAMQASELRRGVELPPAAWACGWSRSWPTRSSTTSRASRARCAVHALLELWEKRKDNALTLAAYRESGVHGAVARLAEARTPASRTAQALVRAIALRLVGEGEGEADAPVRRRAPLAELDLECNEDVADVLATLADSRLVSVGEGSVGGRPRGAAARMATPARVDRAGHRGAGSFAATSPRRRPNGTLPRDQGELYRGARLAAALDWSGGRRSTSTSSSESSRPSRGLRAEAARPAHEPAPPHPAGPEWLSAWSPPSREGRSPSSSAGTRDDETAQRPAPRRPGARRGGLRSFAPACAQAVAIDDSPQTRSYLLADLLRPRGHGRHARPRATSSARSRSAQTGARGRRLPAGLLFFDARIRADREAGAGERRGGEPRGPADGRTVAFGGSGYIRLSRARGSSLPRLAPPRRGLPDVSRLTFTRDGSRLVVVASGDSELCSISLHAAALAELVLRSTQPAGRLRTAPTRLPGFALAQALGGQRIGPGRARLVGSRTRKATRRDRRGSSCPCVSPDRRTAAVGAGGGSSWSTRAPGRHARRPGPRRSAELALFSPDGKRVVSTSLDGTVALGRESATLRETLRGHSRAAQQPVFGPDREDALHRESRRHGDRLGRRGSAGGENTSGSRAT